MGIQIDGSANTISGLAVGGLPNGSISSDDIASNAVTVAKLASTLDLSSNTVTLPNTSVTAGMLASTLDISGKTVTLPNTSVTAGMLASTLDLSGKTVTLPSGTGGKILQVLQAVKTDIQSNSNDTSWTDITDLSVNITPASSSSKFLLMATIAHSFYGSYNASHFRFAKGGSAISGALGDASANANVLQASFTGSAMNSPNEYNQVTDSMNYLDSPSATSQITYNVQWRVSYAPVSYVNYINQNYQESNDDSRSRTISTFTVIEVAG